MREFIAERIKEAKKEGLEAGRAKYRAYFIKTKMWEKYQDDVDMILTIDGCKDCIVTE